MMNNNPLMAPPSAGTPDQPTEDDGMAQHASIWAHIQQEDPADTEQNLALAEYAIPIMGALAAKKDVTPKDVIRALSDAVGSGKVTPDHAVATITAMPADKTELRPWLQNRFMLNLTYAVHAKAQQIKAQQQQAAQMAPGAMQ